MVKEAILRNNAHKNNKALLWVRSSTDQYDKRRTPKIGDRVQVIFRSLLLLRLLLWWAARDCAAKLLSEGPSVAVSGDEMNLLAPRRLAEPIIKLGSPWSCCPGVDHVR